MQRKSVGNEDARQWRSLWGARPSDQNPSVGDSVGHGAGPARVMPKARMSSNEGGMVDQPGRPRGSGGDLLGMSRLGSLLEIDLRSLALFRIGVAVTLLVDLASRVRDLEAFYGARGVLPPGLARSL